MAQNTSFDVFWAVARSRLLAVHRYHCLMLVDVVVDVADCGGCRWL
jgi:hypothetical protein